MYVRHVSLMASQLAARVDHFGKFGPRNPLVDPKKFRKCRIKAGAIDAAALDPETGPRQRTRKIKVFSILVVISLVGTI